MSAPEGSELLRAAIFHTPRNPFFYENALDSYSDGGLLIGHGRVLGCGNYGELREKHPRAHTRDLRDGVLLPGLVDTHTHFPQVRVLGGLGLSLLDWLDQHTLPEEARFSDINYARTVAAEFVSALAAHGTTTAAAFGSHFAAATVAMFQAAAKANLRISSGLVLSDRGLRPELRQTPEAAYMQSKALIREFHRKNRLLYAVTPRFALSASEAMLEVCQTLLREHPDLRFQTHINENRLEISQTLSLSPWASDYLAIYERYQLVRATSILAHNVYPSESELQRLAQQKATVAHCPSSNAALGSGFFPMQRHLMAEVRFALGTDVGGGTGFGMLKEGLQAYLVQRLAAPGYSLRPAHLLYLATQAGAEALGLENEIGSFAEGKAADFVYLRPQENTPLAAISRQAKSPEAFLAALFTLASADTVQEVRVAGTLVYPDPAKTQTA